MAGGRGCVELISPVLKSWLYLSGSAGARLIICLNYCRTGFLYSPAVCNCRQFRCGDTPVRQPKLCSASRLLYVIKNQYVKVSDSHFVPGMISAVRGCGQIPGGAREVRDTIPPS